MSRRVLIVDDHQQIREAVRGTLEADGWVVAGEAATGRSALRELMRLDFDVVLLDLGLPDISGLQVAGQIARSAPDVAVVMTSSQDSGDYRRLALDHGARGFVAKADLTGAALDKILRT